MKFGLFVIRDNVAKEFGADVFVAKNDGVAMRGYRVAMSKTSSPDDFSLYHVGWYDTESGEVEGLVPNREVSPFVQEREEDKGI